MGANVWERESGGTSSNGGKRSNQGEFAAHEAPSTTAATEEAGTQPCKKQRLSTAVALSPPANEIKSQEEPLASRPAPAATDGVPAAHAESSSQPVTNASPPGSIHPGQHHPGRHRNGGRGSSYPSRGGGGRHYSGPGRGRGQQGLQDKGQETVAAAGQSDVRGRGRAGGRHSGRGRGRDGGGRAASHHHQQQQQQSEAAAEEALKAKEKELEALKARIAQQQAKQDALKAAQQLHKHQQQQQQELQQRKSRLNNAFGSAFANAAKQQQEQKSAASAATAAAGSSNTVDQAAADDVEVKRVLSSKNDYDVLQLKPGCDKAALKQRYKEMAVRLHPDKCKAADATIAFQRAHKAYMALQAHVL